MLIFVWFLVCIPATTTTQLLSWVDLHPKGYARFSLLPAQPSLVSQVDHSCGQSGSTLLWSVRWIIPVVSQVVHFSGQSVGSFLCPVRWCTPLVSQVDHSCGQAGSTLLWSVRWIIPLVKQCPFTFSSLHYVPSNNTPFHTMPSSQGDSVWMMGRSNPTPN